MLCLIAYPGNGDHLTRHRHHSDVSTATTSMPRARKAAPPARLLAADIVQIPLRREIVEDHAGRVAATRCERVTEEDDRAFFAQGRPVGVLRRCRGPREHGGVGEDDGRQQRTTADNRELRKVADRQIMERDRSGSTPSRDGASSDRQARCPGAAQRSPEMRGYSRTPTEERKSRWPSSASSTPTDPARSSSSTTYQPARAAHWRALGRHGADCRTDLQGRGEPGRRRAGSFAHCDSDLRSVEGLAACRRGARRGDHRGGSAIRLPRPPSGMVSWLGSKHS